MLPKIARLKSGLPRRARWGLTVCSLALFALPTWFVAAQSEDVKLKPVAPAASKTTTTEVKSTGKSAASDAAAVSEQPATLSAVATDAAGTTQSAPSAVEFFPELSQKEQFILSELDKPTTFDFTDESLDGVREALMERHGFDILIDKAKLEEASVTTDATDLTLRVNEVPLRSALRLLLRGKNLAYVIEDDVMKITTEIAYATDRLTRTYPVSDLVADLPGADVPDFQSLMEAIRQGVTPGCWKESANWNSGAQYSAPIGPLTGGPQLGGGGPVATISMVPASSSLVIHQTWQGHDEVLKLLRALRKAKKLSPRIQPPATNYAPGPTNKST